MSIKRFVGIFTILQSLLTLSAFATQETTQDSTQELTDHAGASTQDSASSSEKAKTRATKGFNSKTCSGLNGQQTQTVFKSKQSFRQLKGSDTVYILKGGKLSATKSKNASAKAPYCEIKVSSSVRNDVLKFEANKAYFNEKLVPEFVGFSDSEGTKADGCIFNIKVPGATPDSNRLLSIRCYVAQKKSRPSMGEINSALSGFAEISDAP